MKISLSEALVIMGIGLLGLIGSIQLENELSTMNIGVEMGPAKYTLVISLILLVGGMIPVIGYLRRKTDREGAFPRIITARGMILIAILLAWVAAVPFLGFNIGNLCFFPPLFQVAGLRPWMKSLMVGVITAVIFYVVFVLGAKLPVPKGGLGIW